MIVIIHNFTNNNEFIALDNFKYTPEDLMNDDFMIASIISFFTVFFIFRKFVFVYVGWGPFFCLGWFYVIENIALTFLTNTYMFIYIFFFFNIFYIIYLFIYFIFWYYRTCLMYCYTIYEYEHYFWDSVLDALRYKVLKSFLTKHFLKKNINKNMLDFSLNYNFNLYLKLLSYFYFLFFFIFLYFHFKNFNVWFNYSILDISNLFNTYYSNIILILYYLIFIKLLINSIFFDKLLSINFLRSFNLVGQSSASDDGLNWTGRYWELVLFYEEVNVEESGLNIMNSFLGDRKYKKLLNFWVDFDSFGAYNRFFVPISWLKYKTYVIDSYNTNIVQLLLFKMYSFIIYICNSFFLWAYTIPYTEIEFLLELDAQWD